MNFDCLCFTLCTISAAERDGAYGRFFLIWGLYCLGLCYALLRTVLLSVGAFLCSCFFFYGLSLLCTVTLDFGKVYIYLPRVSIKNIDKYTNFIKLCMISIQFSIFLPFTNIKKILTSACFSFNPEKAVKKKEEATQYTSHSYNQHTHYYYYPQNFQEYPSPNPLK